MRSAEFRIENLPIRNLKSQTWNRKWDVEINMQRFTRVLESMIREYPDHGFGSTGDGRGRKMTNEAPSSVDETLLAESG
jgi:hypothetical protein